MDLDLQKASLWKRIAAWMLDAILVCVLTVGCAYCLSLVLDYDGYAKTLEDSYAYYEEQYQTSFDVDQMEYDAMSEQERKNYDDAYKALIADEDAMYAYNMLINLSLIIATLSILAAMLILEFAVPMLLSNGATIGKKVFSLGLIRTDGVKISKLQLFVRALIGKYTLETMIPVYLVLMLFWGAIDITGTIILLGIGIAQIVIYATTRTNSQIHDLLASTVVVDVSSQRIFDSTDDLIRYQKQVAAERAARQDY